MIGYGCRDVVGGYADFEVIDRDCVRYKEEDGGLIMRLVEGPAIERSCLVAVSHGGVDVLAFEAMCSDAKSGIRATFAVEDSCTSDRTRSLSRLMLAVDGGRQG
jgi:hypothetical protein